MAEIGCQGSAIIWLHDRMGFTFNSLPRRSIAEARSEVRSEGTVEYDAVLLSGEERYPRCGPKTGEKEGKQVDTVNFSATLMQPLSNTHI